MWLFDKYVQWRTDSRIHSLEQALAEKPSPQLYLQLADAHKETGNQVKSAQVLKLGAARFPTAPEIVRRQAETEKIEREIEKKRLLERIQTHPNPILYARLAELYKADNELALTMDTCQRGIKAFPKYGGTYLVLGQIFAEKRQWPEAVAQLEKSVALDKYNYLALKLLASVYMQQGRPADAIQRLDDILFFAPGDESILDLQRKARTVLEASIPKVVAIAPGTRTVISKPPSRSSNMPNVGRPSSLPPAAPKVSTKDQLLAKGLADLRAVGGVSGAILVDQYGLTIASNLDSSFDEGLVGALITNVYRTASTHSVKLGVGQFEEGVIEGEDGNIHIVQFDDMILTIFAKSDAKFGLLEKSIRNFAETALAK